MNVVAVPGSLDHQTVDGLLDAVAAMQEQRSLFDARHVRWVDPNGMVALLAAGSVARDRQGALPRLELPESVDVLGYLSRMGFFREAQGIFDFDGHPPRRGSGTSDVLLEITQIQGNADVHKVIDRVQSGTGAVLASKLHYPATAVVPFSVILSEVCQNIIEHADAPGWVTAHSYNWSKRLGVKSWSFR